MLKREILFRGKRLDNGRWVEGFYSNLYIEEKGKEQAIITYQDFYPAYMSYPYPSVNTVEAEVDPETIGLYTGLNAKKKKINLSEKIFEGDIFRGLNDNDIEKYYVVMWIEQRAAFYMVPADHYCVLKDNDLSNDDDFNWLFDDAMLYDFSSDCSLTKVGNIHDNKELLK